MHNPKLASFWEVEEKWDICDLFDAHEIMDIMQVVNDDKQKKIDNELRSSRKK